MKKYSLFVAVLIIVVLAVGFYIFKAKPQPNNAPITNQPVVTAPKENPIKFSGQAAIEIPATVPAGDRLTATKILMPGNGFVVVKDSAGKIIGASNIIIFPETDNFKIAVNLVSGQKYSAELRGDNGNGVFDPAADPLIIIGGKSVTASFKVK